MKIGFLTTYFPPLIDGGAENNCYYLAREIAKKHEVHIFTSDRKEGKTAPKEDTFDNLKIHRFKTIARYKYYLSWNKGLIQRILKEDLDILHVHSIGFIQHDIAIILKKLFSKTKLINTPHGPFLANETHNIFIKALREIYRIIEYPINRCYDFVIDVNGRQERWLPQFGFNKIRYCPNGIPKERFKKVDNKPVIKKYNLKNKFVISTLGRLVEYKGFDQIIKILPKLTKEKPNLVYICMGGDKGDLKRLKELSKKLNVEKNIIFTERVSEKEKLQVLETSNVFLLTSAPGTEVFGIVLLEGMARNNAIISTKVEGDNILIKEGINGFVYDYSDLDKLKNRLLLLIKDKKLNEKMKKENLKVAKSYINENISKNYLEKIYIEVLKK